LCPGYTAESAENQMVVPSLNKYTNYMHEKYILKAPVRPDHGRYDRNCFTASINSMTGAE
jgi:hypothetical protein